MYPRSDVTVHSASPHATMGCTRATLYFHNLSRIFTEPPQQPYNVGLYAAIHVHIDLYVSLQGDAATGHRFITIIFVAVDALFRAVWRNRVIGLGGYRLGLYG